MKMQFRRIDAEHGESVVVEECEDRDELIQSVALIYDRIRRARCGSTKHLKSPARCLEVQSPLEDMAQEPKDAYLQVHALLKELKCLMSSVLAREKFVIHGVEVFLVKQTGGMVADPLRDALLEGAETTRTQNLDAVRPLAARCSHDRV